MVKHEVTKEEGEDGIPHGYPPDQYTALSVQSQSQEGKDTNTKMEEIAQGDGLTVNPAQYGSLSHPVQDGKAEQCGTKELNKYRVW